MALRRHADQPVIQVDPDLPPIPLQDGLLTQTMTQRFEQALTEKGQLFLMYADIVRFQQAEQLLGPQDADRLLVRLPAALVRALHQAAPEANALQVHHIWGDDFLVYFTLSGGGEARDWESTVQQIARLAVLEVNPRRSLGVQIELQAAIGRLQPGGASLRAEIARLVKQLQQRARRGAEAGEEMDLRKLLHTGEGLRSVYQPIVSLIDGRIAGYEALSRGPAGTPLASPLALFARAREQDQLFSLEIACRRLAIEGARGLRRDQLLFLNVEAQTVLAHDFVQGKTRAMLAEVGLTPENVIIEVTERSSVEDFATFRTTLQHYRAQGFRVAVDDAGAGYSSLQAISELRPDFIKIDRSLVAGVATNPVQTSLLRTLVDFAREVGCHLVAEGIETPADLMAVRRLGVEYAQGYLLAAPACPRPELSPGVLGYLARQVGQSPQPEQQPLSALLVEAPTVRMETPVAEVEELIAAYPAAAGAVTVREGRPTGYLSWARLWRHLGAPFSRVLAEKVSVSDCHDPQPLILPAQTPARDAALRAACRPAHRTGDDIVVVDDDGQFLGVVTLNSLLSVLAERSGSREPCLPHGTITSRVS